MNLNEQLTWFILIQYLFDFILIYYLLSKSLKEKHDKTKSSD